MANPFVVGPETQGRWLYLDGLGTDGSKVRIKFEPGKGLIVQRVLDPRIMRAVIEEARHSRDIHKKGTMLKGTQKHWLPLAKLPKAIDAKFKRELGPAKENPKGWLRRLNDSDYRNFRTSEHSLA